MRGQCGLIVESAPALPADKRLVLGITSGPFGTKKCVGRDSIDQSFAESHKHHDGITDRSGVDFVDGVGDEVAGENVETIGFRVVRGGSMRLGNFVCRAANTSEVTVVGIRQAEAAANVLC